jgi:hypothetical protein
MKAQFVKTFIKAAAIVALATSIANCGAMPEESITETTYQPSSPPTAPTATDESEGEGELIEDGCEAFGLVFDAANMTCVDDESEINIINPPVEGPTEPELVEDGCEAFGLIEENGTCVEPELELETVEVEVDPVDALNFVVTPGSNRIDVTFTRIEGATSYSILRFREGSSRVDYVPVNGTTYGFLTFYCSAYSYKLVANMADGTTVETPATDYVAPTNCE